MASPSALPLIENDPGDLAALAGAGAIAEKEARGIGSAILGDLEQATLLGGIEAARQVTLEGRAGVDQRFQLRRGQQSVRDDLRAGSNGA